MREGEKQQRQHWTCHGDLITQLSTFTKKPKTNELNLQWENIFWGF